MLDLRFGKHGPFFQRNLSDVALAKVEAWKKAEAPADAQHPQRVFAGLDPAIQKARDAPSHFTRTLRTRFTSPKNVMARFIRAIHVFLLPLFVIARSEATKQPGSRAP